MKIVFAQNVIIGIVNLKTTVLVSKISIIHFKILKNDLTKFYIVCKKSD